MQIRRKVILKDAKIALWVLAGAFTLGLIIGMTSCNKTPVALADEQIESAVIERLDKIIALLDKSNQQSPFEMIARATAEKSAKKRIGNEN